MSQSVRRPRILLADDDASVSAAISRLLSRSCDVVGSVRDSPTLFAAAEQLQPDIVLLDFSLPGGPDALEVCRRIKEKSPQVSVIAFTGHDDDELRQLSHEAGAAAFVWKLRAATDLLAAIQAVVERSAGSRLKSP